MMTDQTRTVLAMAHYLTTGRWPPEYAEAVAWCRERGCVENETLTPAGKSFWAGRTVITEGSYR
jgi:hypothetical protein